MLRHQCRTVLVGPTCIDVVPVVERAGGHEEHTGLYCPCGTYGRKSEFERFVPCFLHTVFACPVYLVAYPLHTLCERPPGFRCGDFVGSAARLLDRNRTVQAEKLIVEEGSHETCFCPFGAALEFSHFETFVEIFQKDVYMSDSLIVAGEEIEVVTGVSIIVVRRHQPFLYVFDKTFHSIGGFVGAPEIRNLSGVVHFRHHEVIAVYPCIPFVCLHFGGENFLEGVQSSRILFQEVGAGRYKQQRCQYCIYKPVFHISIEFRTLHSIR